MTAPDDMTTAQSPGQSPGQNPGTPGPAAAPTPSAGALPADALIVLPTRNLVLFPEMVFPLAIGRPATLAARAYLNGHLFVNKEENQPCRS